MNSICKHEKSKALLFNYYLSLYISIIGFKATAKILFSLPNQIQNFTIAQESSLNSISIYIHIMSALYLLLVFPIINQK